MDENLINEFRRWQSNYEEMMKYGERLEWFLCLYTLVFFGVSRFEMHCQWWMVDIRFMIGWSMVLCLFNIVLTHALWSYHLTKLSIYSMRRQVRSLRAIWIEAALFFSLKAIADAEFVLYGYREHTCATEQKHFALAVFLAASFILPFTLICSYAFVIRKISR